MRDRGMAPIRKEALEARRDSRRKQIREAALNVFARAGVEGARMSHIAAEAKVSHGLFYRYFPSKQALHAALVRELTKEALDAISRLAQGPGRPVEKLRALTSHMLDEDHRPAFQLMLRSRAADRLPRAVKALLARYPLSAYLAPLIPVVRAGQRAGELVEGDPATLLTWYFDVVNGLLLSPLGSPREGRPTVDFLSRLLAR